MLSTEEETKLHPSRPVVTFKITLPTKEDVVKALQEKYPGITVEEVVEEKPATSE